MYLNGTQPYQDEKNQLARAAGIIEMTGRHEGRAATLIVGFTDQAEQLPTFLAKDAEAVGTMTLHTPAVLSLCGLGQVTVRSFQNRQSS